MQSQKIQSHLAKFVAYQMTDFQIILSIQMKNQFILLKYIFFVLLAHLATCELLSWVVVRPSVR